MTSVAVIQAIAGVSTIVGLLALIAYFLSLIGLRNSRTSVEGLLTRQGVISTTALKEIPDAQRLEALKALIEAEAKRNSVFADKVKNDIDLTKIMTQSERYSHKRIKLLAMALIAIGVIAFAASAFGVDRRPKPDPCDAEDPPVGCILGKQQ